MCIQRANSFRFRPVSTLNNERRHLGGPVRTYGFAQADSTTPNRPRPVTAPTLRANNADVCGGAGLRADDTPPPPPPPLDLPAWTPESFDSFDSASSASFDGLSNGVITNPPPAFARLDAGAPIIQAIAGTLHLDYSFSLASGPDDVDTSFTLWITADGLLLHSSGPLTGEGSLDVDLSVLGHQPDIQLLEVKFENNAVSEGAEFSFHLTLSDFNAS